MKGSHDATPGLSMRIQFTWMAALTGILVLSPLLPTYTFTSGIGAYDAVHTVLEFASIAVSFMVFALAWNLRHLQDNFALLILGLASFAAATIDIAHVLSYVGMPELVTPSGGQKSVTFWLLGRFIAALGFLAIAIVRDRHVSKRAWAVGMLAVTLLLVPCLWIGLVQPDWLPVLYTDASGLTALKKVLEYGIAGIYAAAALMLIRRARRDGDREMAWLAAATWTLALTDVFFTLYANVTDSISVIAHVYKVIAYGMIYLAIFAAGVRRPYDEAANERSLLRSLIDSMPDLIVVKDPQKRFIVANRAYQAYEHRNEASLKGRTSSEVVEQGAARVLEAMDDQVLDSGATLRADVVMPSAAGVERTFDTLKAPFLGPANEALGVISLLRDVTDDLARDAELEQLSHYDPLTGLPNLSLLTEAAQRELDIAELTGQSIAFVVLDLDDFHTINEAIGHDSGDALLQQVAQRLRAGIRPRDVVARPGGDEFVILLTDQNPGDASLIVARLIEEARRPFAINGQDTKITLSAGIAMFPDNGSTFAELRRFAEAALYRAKSEGRDTLRFFTEEMQEHAATRLQTLNGLRTALDRGEFRVHYQPQIRLEDGAVCGVEALVRWEHPTQGLVPPGAFIPLAEETGLILPLGDWVAATALADAQAWRSAGFMLPSVSINLSAAQFRQADLAVRLTQIANDAGFPFADIEWELTESSTMLDPEGSVAIIQSLHDRGFQVSLDDFGTGYSSLSYLKRYRIDKLKIDQSFVRDLAVDPDDRSIVKAIVQLARVMDCRVVAEGVETDEQLVGLRAEGCDVAQGYLFARPMPADEMQAFLQTRQLTELPTR